MYFDENKFIINNGRKATLSGIIGILLGVIFSKIMSFSLSGMIIFALFSGYIFLTAFWGAYKINFWFRRYKYKIPSFLWQIMRVLLLFVGIILGILGWGFFEHFILLISMGSGNKDGPGMIAAQLILIPYIGRYYARYLEYQDGY